MMTYFRRPQLAGRNLPRTSYATIRGSVRRKDADVSSAQPYFPGVTAGQTLSVRIQGVTYVATFSDNKLSSILSTLNTAVGANGRAFDDAGCIALQSNTAGYTSEVAVTAGSAAVGLGFDLVASTLVISRGGDVPSSAEGRRGNWQGVAFPEPGAPLSADTINRVAGRLAGNMDVLHAAQVRSLAKLQAVGNITGASQTTWTPGGADALKRIFNGYGVLSAASTKEALAPYFYLMDVQTGRMAPQRVVGLTRGTPAGAPPYANAPSFSDTTGKNVLGLSLLKVDSITINDVREDRVAVCPGADFSQVQAGDWVEVAGATNVVPFSHNGLRWAVERVVGTDGLALRPLCRRELELAGQSFSEVQPITELNGVRPGGTVYGTLKVFTGPFLKGCTFVFDKPLSPGGTYQLWAAQPLSLAEEHPWESQQSHLPLYNELGGQKDVFQDGIVSGLSVSLSGGEAVVSSGIVRWNGQKHAVPGRSFTFAQASAGPSPFVVWDASDFQLKLVAVLGAQQHLVAQVLMDGVSITSVRSLVRRLAEGVRNVTVGARGQFLTLDDAFRHLNALGTATQEADIELLDSNVAMPTVELLVNYARIRGFSPGAGLVALAASTLRWGGTGQLVLEDLELQGVASSAAFVTFSAGTPSLTLRNVHQVSGSYTRVVQSAGAAGLASVQLIDCAMFLTHGVVASASAASTRTHLERCYFVQSGSVAGQRLFSTEDGSGFLAGKTRVAGSVLKWDATVPLLHAGRIEGSYLEGSFTFSGVLSDSTVTGALTLDADGLLDNSELQGVLDVTGTPGQLTVQSCRLGSTLFPNGKTFPSGSRLVVDGCIVTGAVGGESGLIGYRGNVVLSNSHFLGMVRIGACILNASRLENPLNTVRTASYDSGSPYTSAEPSYVSSCVILGDLQFSGEANVAHCEFYGNVSNTVANLVLRLDNCIVRGIFQMLNHKVLHLQMTNCQVLTECYFGLNGSQAIAGGIDHLLLSGCTIFSNARLGVNIQGTVAACHFHGEVYGRGAALNTHTAFSSSSFHGSYCYLWDGTWDHAACHFFAQAIFVPNTLYQGSYRVHGNFFQKGLILTNSFQSSVSENRFDGAVGYNGHALLARANDTLHICDNAVRGQNTTLEGSLVFVGAYSGTNSARVTVTGNTVTQDATGTNRYAFYIDYTDEFVIDDNTFVTNSGGHANVAVIKGTAAHGILGKNFLNTRAPDGGVTAGRFGGIASIDVSEHNDTEGWTTLAFSQRLARQDEGSLYTHTDGSTSGLRQSGLSRYTSEPLG